jgi:hypothetical protein
MHGPDLCAVTTMVAVFPWILFQQIDVSAHEIQQTTIVTALFDENLDLLPYTVAQLSHKRLDSSPIRFLPNTTSCNCNLAMSLNTLRHVRTAELLIVGQNQKDLQFFLSLSIRFLEMENVRLFEREPCDIIPNSWIKQVPSIILSILAVPNSLTCRVLGIIGKRKVNCCEKMEDGGFFICVRDERISTNT